MPCCLVASNGYRLQSRRYTYERSALPVPAATRLGQLFFFFSLIELHIPKYRLNSPAVAAAAKGGAHEEEWNRNPI